MNTVSLLLPSFSSPKVDEKRPAYRLYKRMTGRQLEDVVVQS